MIFNTKKAIFLFITSLVVLGAIFIFYPELFNDTKEQETLKLQNRVFNKEVNTIQKKELKANVVNSVSEHEKSNEIKESAIENIEKTIRKSNSELLELSKKYDENLQDKEFEKQFSESLKNDEEYREAIIRKFQHERALEEQKSAEK